MSRLLITDVRLLDDAHDLIPGWLRADDGRITALGPGEPPQPHTSGAPERRLDGQGRILTPGLIDMHSHGGGGASVDAGAAAIRTTVAAAHRHGVTGMILSLVTAAPETLEAQLAGIAALAEAHAGHPAAAQILGVHLEGPFISPAQAGAHDPHLIRSPSPALLRRLHGAAGGLLRYLTIAPELPGALETIAAAVEHGIVCGIGHTSADYATARAGFDAGARVLTHAFNAMPGIGHRSPGPVAAALDDERVGIELICDGVHVQAPVVRLLAGAAGRRLILITDAMAAAGQPDGTYTLGALPVTVAGGIARITGTDTIAGSTLTLDAAVAGAISMGLSHRAAIAAATAAPAAALGLRDRGRLAVGQRADLVLWAEGMRISQVLQAAQ